MNSFVKNLICIALVLNFFSLSEPNKRVKRIVGGRMSAVPPPDDPVIFAKTDNRYARVEGYRNPGNGLYSYQAIRFVHPPIGNDRFRRPRFLRLEGDINATVPGMPCPQPDSEGYIVGSEDCLWLNVFIPQMPDETTSLPVIFWIHGGGYRYGSANQYTADSLISKGVIFVAIQYRLGTLGILGDGTTEFSGNAALFDMMAALRWVHEYIAFFGGNPKQIVIMGQGSGATAATYLTTTQIKSRELVSGVVAMSGSPYSQNSIDETPLQSVQEIAAINNCSKNNETEIVKCMRAKSAEDIIRHDSQVQVERLHGDKIVKSMNGNVGYNPSVQQANDERSLPSFLPEDPRYVIGNGTFRKVPILTGTTRDETANAIDIKNIEKIFSTSSKFLESLATSVKKGGLGFGNVVGKMLPGVEKALSLTEYLKVSDQLSVMQVISKLTEATTDALFNLPAILTAQTWAKVAPAYLYSFEHVSQNSHRNRGSTFLNGLPIVGNANPANDTVAHGDELTYLFDARDIFGQTGNDTASLDARDTKVRDFFTNLITQFAHFSSNQGIQNNSIFQAFKSDESNFIRIGEETKVDKDFRYCQMALWGALVKPSSKDISCKFIANQLASSLLSATGGLTSSLGNTFGSVFHKPSAGPTSPRNSSTSKVTGKQNGGLFGTEIL